MTNQVTQRGCKPLSSGELEDLQAAFWPGAEPNELRRKLIVAVMQADAKFEAAGVGGTKRWIECFFLPELQAQSLTIGPVEELSRYKQALQRANGFLIMHNLEPVKLEYSPVEPSGQS